MEGSQIIIYSRKQFANKNLEIFAQLEAKINDTAGIS